MALKTSTADKLEDEEEEEKKRGSGRGGEDRQLRLQSLRVPTSAYSPRPTALPTPLDMKMAHLPSSVRLKLTLDAHWSGSAIWQDTEDSLNPPELLWKCINETSTTL
ncbi:hypothetical protein MGYG_06932 [Nannizzia gypsea CBS 118893]|uniref:Uncharacterized protein n=1 Tax=Arthroderma gypseum (strain ATCC MYA-4604 / CBS 118893) TaxID=535722 RepID=E4V1L8_ARTGP|nr:hypothetical protein MGYG_06932 [Nannizzia gypsea CBS 118893]EFR03933.1 hypothetical protein MGYG_06932 [Nannizzia gypsea CBS 118893]